MYKTASAKRSSFKLICLGHRRVEMTKQTHAWRDDQHTQRGVTADLVDA